MFWKVLLHASQDEGLDLILLFPDQVEVMNLPGTIEALKNAEKTLENCMSISTFYHHLGDFLFSQLPVFFMKVTMNGKISLVEGMRKHRKTMRNKCPEQTLQVRIQYCIQLRSSLATMMLNVLHTAFSLFPVITIAVTYRCMLQCLGEQCIKWWKATKLKLCGQRKRSLHHRSSPSDSPASDQGKHQGYLMGCSTTWTSGRGTYGKILNRLNEISYEVQMTLLKLYLLENRQ